MYIPKVVNKVDVKVIYILQIRGSRNKFSADLIYIFWNVHLFVKGVFSGDSFKVYLLKAKVGKSIQEGICFRLKISLMNIKFVAHLLLFNLESNLEEKCDDFVSL